MRTSYLAFVAIVLPTIGHAEMIVRQPRANTIYSAVQFVSILTTAAVSKADHTGLERAFLTKGLIGKSRGGDAITGGQDWSDWKVVDVRQVAPMTVRVDFLVQTSGAHVHNTYHVADVGSSYRVDRISYGR